MAYSGIQNRQKRFVELERLLFFFIIVIIMIIIMIIITHLGTYRPEQLLAVLSMKMPLLRAYVCVCEVSIVDAIK